MEKVSPGFQKWQIFADLASLSTHHMPSHIPLDEILATDGFAIILENIYENSFRKKPLSYDLIFRKAIQKRLETSLGETDWLSPKSCEKADMEQGLAGGFSEIRMNGKLGRHALPLAFAWANSELARCGLKPFIINNEMLENTVEKSAKNPSAYLFSAINACRNAEKANLPAPVTHPDF